jgi:ribosomal-protein-serine acetyltransferase
MENFSKILPLEIDNAELHFVEPTFENAKMVFDTIASNRSHLSPWMDWASDKSTKTPEDSFKFLEIGKNGWDSGKKFNFGIFLNNIYCGNVGVFDVDDEDKSCEIGYWLSKEFVGKGLASASVKALEKEIFSVYHFNRIQIECDKLNTASAKVAQHCGYILEGEIRENQFVPDENRFRTTLLFSKLAKEF